MNPKKRAVTVAVAGTAAGAIGLGIMAMPAGAGEAPELPSVSAQELVESVLKADPPALSGNVAIDNDLGLPAMPGMAMLNVESARVYHDGDHASRIALEQNGSEVTLVQNGGTAWSYDAADNTATKTTLPENAERKHKAAGQDELADPSSAAATMLDYVRQSSTVAVDGTATVADRAAYELVLTPKPTERTLLREVRIAVDAENRLPLRMSVLTNGTTEPALQIGFTDIDFGPQPADLFEFSPPQGAEVTDSQPRNKPEQLPDKPAGEVTGEGWDSVYVGSVPPETLDRRPDSDGPDARGLLDQFGTRVQGEFGSGYVVSTKVGTALITDDGRFAVGAVPQQVLTEALGTR
ncbi:LolA family protein [Prauserella cavernicola]|uniref:Outer membrane lipoprotein carrier protein LolA n=1 Tax=Prauserella cavernicola TaxID=2800127 RepID=A0A934V5G0_9PSEU|nr:outer membrane lipoprotein carrier protein LolA [Prauserella cavernicola]MBK1785679.1 outer membrane lipoprotein carrier protein LolA [Prauserella cavernicola]